MSKYYIYKMIAITEDGSKGSYIGQHKIGRKCPFNDGYKGSGSDWRKYVLYKNIPVEKVILRMCDNVEEANYWEQYYIENAKAQGIYLWNKYGGGGNHKYDRLYTDEEIAEHQRQYSKKRYQVNKVYYKKYYEQYNQSHKEEIKIQKKQYYEINKEHQRQYKKQYREANKEKILEQKKQYDKQICNYNGEILALSALKMRFIRQGIEHPTVEARKYLVDVS